MWVRSLSQEDPLKDSMVTHSSILAEEPHGQGSLWAVVHTVAKSQTQLKQLSTRDEN